MRQSVTKVSALLAVVMASISLTACVQTSSAPVGQQSAKVAISSVRDAAVSYPQGSQFFVKAHYVEEPSLTAEQQQALYGRFVNAIDRNFTQHGYQQTLEKPNAQFLVGYGVAPSTDFSDDKMSEVFGIMPGLQESNDLQKGSFVVYVLDLKTGQQVWRGVAQGFERAELSEQQRKERAQKTVDTVLAQFYK